MPSRKSAPLVRLRARRAGGASIAVMIAAAVLCGCTATPVPAPATASPAPSATTEAPPPVPEGPALVQEGTAEENLPFFREIIQTVWAGDARGQGRAYVDALVGGGFDKAAMQVTFDTSTVSNPAESLQVSVRWREQCLIGQVGDATGEPVAVVVDALPGGACLIGDTRPIDW